MAKKKQEEEIKTDLWKDTFSDLMNLLLCFFVLLYSMSSVDEVKYSELVASMSNSFSIFSGGAQSIGEGQLISSGATQLNNLDEYYSDMGKASEDTDSEDPMAEQKKKQEKDTRKLYSDVVEKTENNRIEDAVSVTMDENYQYVMISLSGGVLFDSGSAEIRKGAKTILSRVSYILKNYKNFLATAGFPQRELQRCWSILWMRRDSAKSIWRLPDEAMLIRWQTTPQQQAGRRTGALRSRSTVILTRKQCRWIINKRERFGNIIL